MALMMMPGMQKPHWTANWSMKACWTGLSVPSGACRPSTVTMSLPSAQLVRYRQVSVATPSMRTVQAPHSPTSQPRLTLVRFRRLRRVSSRLSRGS